MGFFKDFKDDFSQAVNELMPADDNLETSTNEDDVEVNTLLQQEAPQRWQQGMQVPRQKEQQYLCLHLYLNQKEMKQFQILQKQPRRKEKWLTIQQHL